MATLQVTSFTELLSSVFLIISALCIAVQGDFSIAHAPSYMKFLSDAQPILASEIPVLVNSAFGFSIPRDLKWNGLQQGSLFERPQASVIVSVVGDTSIPLSFPHATQYALKSDDPVLLTHTIADNLQRYSERPTIIDFSVDNTIFDVRSRHPELFGDLPATFTNIRDVISRGQSLVVPPSVTGPLDVNVDVDLLFLGELHTIGKIVKALKKHRKSIVDSSPDFYHFTVSGLAKVVERYGRESAQASTARVLLEKLLSTVISDFRQLYADNVLVQIVSLPRATDVLVRKSRSLMSTSPEASGPAPVIGGLASAYDDQYPVAFNIILWTMVVLAITVAAISYGIWFMDPGRDSIIYRMTSQRLKMD